VDLAVVHKLADEFQLHAKRFDALYEGRIPSEAH